MKTHDKMMPVNDLKNGIPTLLIAFGSRADPDDVTRNKADLQNSSVKNGPDVVLRKNNFFW